MGKLSDLGGLSVFSDGADENYACMTPGSIPVAGKLLCSCFKCEIKYYCSFKAMQITYPFTLCTLKSYIGLLNVSIGSEQQKHLVVCLFGY